jgi:transposase
VINSTDIEMLKECMEQINLFEKQQGACLNHLEELAEAYFAREISLLCTIPGIQKYSAMCLLSEIGNDMSAFGKASHLVGWAGLRPRNDESAGKIQSRKITHGNKYLRKALMECACGAARNKGSVLYYRFWHLKEMKKHHNSIIVAIARQLLKIIWTLLWKEEKFDTEYHLKKHIPSIA